MKAAPKPKNEEERLKALQKYEILDTISEQVYEDITKIATEICGTPIALLSLVDSDRQWNKSIKGKLAKEFPREYSFCSHAILDPENLFIVEDARYDERFHDNPLTKGENPVIFYAGMPLTDSQGNALGAICVIDNRPRTLTEEKLMSLRSLGKLVQAHFDLRLANIQLEESNQKILLTQPLVDTILNGIDELESSELKPAQADQLKLVKDTTLALKTIINDQVY